MSRTREVAKEIFGEDGTRMETADVYNALARLVAAGLLEVTVSETVDRASLPPIVTEALDDPELMGRIQAGAAGQFAYTVGYRAQVQDALGKDPKSKDAQGEGAQVEHAQGESAKGEDNAPNYNHLNALAAYLPAPQ